MDSVRRGAQCAAGNSQVGRPPRALRPNVGDLVQRGAQCAAGHPLGGATAAGLETQRSGLGMERYTIMYNAAISACGKAQVWLRAVEFLAAMTDVRGRCTITYRPAISACGKVVDSMAVLADTGFGVQLHVQCSSQCNGAGQCLVMGRGAFGRLGMGSCVARHPLV